MTIQDHLAIFSARGVRLLAKILHRGGTALPGEVALKISPTLPARLLKDKDVLLVSGTNGKTSTVNFLYHLLKEAGYKVDANLAGANLISGITSTVLKARADKRDADVYVFEMDEAHLAKYGNLLNPKSILLTNLFPDQEDRYGSVASLRDLMRRGLRDLDETTFYLPADDPDLCLFADDHEDSVSFFGEARQADFDDFKETAETAPESDSDCPCCGNPLRYAWTGYGNHGGFYCPSCDYGWQSPELTYTIQGDTAELHYRPTGETGTLVLPVRGRHNLINASAALLPLLHRGKTLAELLPLFKNLVAPFGRMEEIEADGKKLTMVLQKNPVGMESGLLEAGAEPKLQNLFIMVNKRENDGTDASWLEQVDYAQKLPETILEDAANRLFVCGEAAPTLVNELKRQGVACRTGEDWRALFDEALAATERGRALYLLPNYSAMLELRGELTKRFDLKEFWE